MEFVGFPPQTLKFLQAIRENNDKEWFEAHKEEYKNFILEPSRAFVEEMGEHLMALEPTLHAIPKINHSLFRIYRDIRRMGADKRPIKSRIGIIFWQGRGSRLQSSSFYLHFSPDELLVAAGVRWFEKPFLDAYRDYIKDERRRAQLQNVIDKLLACGYEIFPKELKRYPKGFDASMTCGDLSLYKSMACKKVLEPKLIEEGAKLIQTLYAIYEDMLPLQQIVYEISLRIKED